MELASNQPIGEMMSKWTGQLGYPVITVSKNVLLKFDHKKII